MSSTHAYRITSAAVEAEGSRIEVQRGSVFEARLAATAREGVNVSAGWQLSKRVTYDSAALSTRQVSLDHIHYDTIAGCRAATELYGKVFRSNIYKEIHSFEELPRCFQEMHWNVQTGIPVNSGRETPARVREVHLLMTTTNNPFEVRSPCK